MYIYFLRNFKIYHNILLYSSSINFLQINELYLELYILYYGINNKNF